MAIQPSKATAQGDLTNGHGLAWSVLEYGSMARVYGPYPPPMHGDHVRISDVLGEPFGGLVPFTSGTPGLLISEDPESPRPNDQERTAGDRLTGTTTLGGPRNHFLHHLRPTGRGGCDHCLQQLGGSIWIASTAGNA